MILDTLNDRKAEDIVSIPLKDKADFADAMVIASGTSSRHVAALAAHLAEALKASGQKIHIEGLDACEWVLVDAGDVIVHLFKPETRAYYRLEKMWSVPAMNDELVSA